MSHLERSVVSPDEWVRLLQSHESEAELWNCMYMVHPSPWNGRPETFDYHVLALVDDGELFCDVAGRQYRLAPGDLLWIPPFHERRFFGKRERSHRLRFGLTHNGSCPYPDSLPSVFRGMWRCQQSFEELHILVKNGHRFVDARLRALMTFISTEVLSEPVDKKGIAGLRIHQRVQLERFIAANIQHNVTPGEMAKHIGLSHQYFSRLFRKAYGVTPRTFLKNERLRIAANLLQETCKSIKEVCADVGINDVGLFHRQFKQYFSKTPTGYRG